MLITVIAPVGAAIAGWGHDHGCVHVLSTRPRAEAQYSDSSGCQRRFSRKLGGKKEKKKKYREYTKIDIKEIKKKTLREI